MSSTLNKQRRSIMIQNKNTTAKGEKQMKKLSFILLACFVSIAIVPLGNAKTPEECEGLRGAEFGLCVAYCQGEECDINPDTAECEDLRTNNEKITGNLYFPCDIIACALCGDPDPDDMTSTIGECVEIPAFECVEPALAVGEYSCDEVTIPANMTPGCDNIDPSWGLIPDCQNGMPAWVCKMFLGGTPVEQCPGVPSCFE